MPGASGAAAISPYHIGASGRPTSPNFSLGCSATSHLQPGGVSCLPLQQIGISAIISSLSPFSAEYTPRGGAAR